MAKCETCHTKIKEEDGKLCANCKRKNGTKRYYTIGILVIIGGFLGGIILGATYKTVAEVVGEYDEYEKIFNVALMLETWIASILFSVWIFGFGSICHRLDLLIDKNKSIEK